MAIDTAEDRRSVAGVGFHLFLGVTPTAAKDIEWRYQVGYSYSGIVTVAAAVVNNEISVGAAIRWPGITPGILGGPGVYS